MSFCFAEKVEQMIDNECITSTHIFCDTKIELQGAVKANWKEEARYQLEKYGVAKTIIVDPCACLSFAGNKIERVDDLLSWLEENGPCEVNDFVAKAFEIHTSSADLNDIEFLITVKEDDCSTPEIISVKNGKVSRNCYSAWIGSYDAFHYLQDIRTSRDEVTEISLIDFWKTVKECKDETVGGYPIEVRFCHDHFEYGSSFATWTGKTQIVKPGEEIVLFQGPQDGGFSVTSVDYSGEPMLIFEQGGFAVLYTRNCRYYDPETYHPATKYLLLPVLIDSKTGKPIWQCSD